jgi:succinoglycan biosynthesis protein ExoM
MSRPDPGPARPDTGDTSAGSGVTVAVLTYRRPADLAALLPLLADQAEQASIRTGILVVDNDPAASAREYVESLIGRGIRYVHEPTPGIAGARNRAIDESAGSEVLVFIDDDERPVEGWLQSLLDTYRRTGADGVVGPVSSVFTGELDPWIAAGGFFTRRQLDTGTVVSVAATNNLLLSVPSLRRRGLRFDPRLNLIGGEDNLFTNQLSSSGGRIVWCAEALVHDIVPAERMTRGWVLRRAYRMGNGTSLVIVRLADSPLTRGRARIRQVLLGASRLVLGLARLLLGLLTGSLTRRAGGVRNCARGLGLITGAFGYIYAEYRRPPSAQPRVDESVAGSTGSGSPT